MQTKPLTLRHNSALLEVRATATWWKQDHWQFDTLTLQNFLRDNIRESSLPEASNASDTAHLPQDHIYLSITRQWHPRTFHRHTPTFKKASNITIEHLSPIGTKKVCQLLQSIAQWLKRKIKNPKCSKLVRSLVLFKNPGHPSFRLPSQAFHIVSCSFW